MPVTLTDEQVADFRQRMAEAETNRQIAEAAAKIWNSPERGDRAKALWKEEFPDADLGSYDVEARVKAELDRRDKVHADADKARREREQDESMAAQRKAIQERYSATDDAMTRLEKMMVEKNVGDYEIAAEHMFSREPRVSDGGNEYDPGFWNHQQREGFEEISRDPEGWGRREILKTLRQEERRNRGGWR